MKGIAQSRTSGKRRVLNFCWMKEGSIECLLCARHSADTEGAVRIFRVESLQQILCL